MNKKNLIFFADKGLTSTSANHIANMAKEHYASLEVKMSKMSFINKTIIINDKERVLEKGISDQLMNQIQEDVDKISDYKALIAWLREAINAKNAELETLKYMKVSDNDNEFNSYLSSISFERKFFNYKRLSQITDNDVLAEMPISERVRYYTLDAKAANIGKLIHSGGCFALARNKAFNNNGISTIVDDKLYTYAYSCDEKLIEDKFFELQSQHRSINAELNSIKYNISAKVMETNLERIKLNSSYDKEEELYNKELSNHLKEFILIESKRVGDLKIVIPDSLKAIYETLI